MKPVALPAAAGELSQAQRAAPHKPNEKALKAAREFESMLLKHVLESMQKASHLGGSESKSSSAYQSMAVEALADGVERGGGLGLADLIAKTLESEVAGRSR